MIYNIDKYDIKLYNEFLNNLTKHNIDYTEYVCTRDNKFYLSTQLEPFILDYTPIQNASKMFLISKTKGVNNQDAYQYRRQKVAASKDNLKLCINDAYQYFIDLNQKQKNSIFYFINIPNKERAEAISKQLGRLYYFGFYYNKYRVYLTNNQYTTNYIDPENILVSSSDLFDAEMQLNYNIFRLQDRLKKFSQTPYRENGTTVLPKYIDPFFRTQVKVQTNSNAKN